MDVKDVQIETTWLSQALPQKGQKNNMFIIQIKPEGSRNNSSKNRFLLELMEAAFVSFMIFIHMRLSSLIFNRYSNYIILQGEAGERHQSIIVRIRLMSFNSNSIQHSYGTDKMMRTIQKLEVGIMRGKMERCNE